MRPTLFAARLARPAALALAVVGAWAGCGDDDDGSGGAPDARARIDAAAADGNPGAVDAADGTDGGAAVADASATPDGAPAVTCTPQAGTGLRLVEVARDLMRPVFGTAPAGDGRLFIVEQPGTIRIVKDGQLLATPFLDISARVRDLGNEQGLLGLAFHPQYRQNGRFFVDYTATSPSGDTVIAEYAVSADPDRATATEVRRILVIDQPQSNHNGGWIGFGPDGFLYIGMGDGGGANDEHPDNIQHGQSLDHLLGKVLRIDIDSGDPYGVPASNPFVGAAGLDEIWAYGLRNPWRASFDRQTGDLYIGDVGQGSVEEIDFQPAASGGGENYGWVHYEGSSCFDPPAGNPGCNGLTGYTFPVTEYSHAGGRCSVTGGYVYRGGCLLDYQGFYFYGDYCTGDVYVARVVDGAAMDERTITSELDPNGLLGAGLSSFGEDAAGELYATSFNGRVYRVEHEP